MGMIDSETATKGPMARLPLHPWYYYVFLITPKGSNFASTTDALSTFQRLTQERIDVVW